ncbi:hypothetical protein BHE74_00013776, partial [Ensete ventricosum]
RKKKTAAALGEQRCPSPRDQSNTWASNGEVFAWYGSEGGGDSIPLSAWAHQTQRRTDPPLIIGFGLSLNLDHHPLCSLHGVRHRTRCRTAALLLPRPHTYSPFWTVGTRTLHENSGEQGMYEDGGGYSGRTSLRAWNRLPLLNAFSRRKVRTQRCFLSSVESKSLSNSMQKRHAMSHPNPKVFFQGRRYRIHMLRNLA